MLIEDNIRGACKGMIFDGTLLKGLFLVGCPIYFPNLGISTMVHYNRAENRQVREVYGTTKKHFILLSACQLATFEKGAKLNLIFRKFVPISKIL